MNNHTIRKVTSTGVVTTVAGTAGVYGNADGIGAAARFSGPQDVAVDRLGNLFVADSYNSTIRKITPAGVVSTVAGSAGSTGNTDGVGTAARFNYPLGIEVNSAGVLYVADCNNHTIRKIATDGVVTTLCGTPLQFGSVDGVASAARFAYPQDLVVDSTGILYVADGGNHTIRKITPAGVVSTFAGAGGVAGSNDGIGSFARFNYPCSLALGSGGSYM